MTSPRIRASSGGPLRVVIAGGGVAALEAAVTLRHLAGERVAVTLLTPATEFSYRPLAVSEPFSGPVGRHYPLRAIVEDLGLEHRRASLHALDPAARTVTDDSGETLPYDALLLATGARLRRRYRRALTIDDRVLDEQLHGLVQDVEAGLSRRVVFLVGPGASWPLPIYELAMMTATRAYEMGVSGLVTVVTPEAAPLLALGAVASRAAARLLASARVSIVAGSTCTITQDGRLLVDRDGRELPADRIVALPELLGAAIPGITAIDEHGFVIVDAHGAVPGAHRVFAAGDATSFPVKHGSIAAQQATAAAEAIAALAGVSIDPRPLRPTVNALLVGGPRRLYLRATLVDGVAVESVAGEEPLWEGSHKVATACLGRYLDRLDRAARVSMDRLDGSVPDDERADALVC